MPEVIIPAEKDIIESILTKKKKIAEQRRVFERQWMTNIAFLYGKHYFAVDRMPILSETQERVYWELKSLERKKKTRRTGNYILPLYRSLLARMIQMKANIMAEPETRSARDVESAKVTEEVLEDFWENANKTNPILCKKYAGMLTILIKLFGYMLTMGRGFLIPYFNPDAKDKVVFPKQDKEDEIETLEAGKVEAEVDYPLNVFEDYLGRFIIRQKIRPVEDIKSKYGVTVKPERIGGTEIEQQLIRLLEGTAAENMEDAVRTYDFWQIPTEEKPNGKHTIITQDKLIHQEDIPDYHKGTLPFFGFDYLIIPVSDFPQGTVEQLISLQEEYNFTLSKIAAYKKWFSGKLKVPRNCKLTAKYDDEVGQVIKYDPAFGEPHFEAPPNPPSFLYDDLQRIRRDMEDIAGVHEVSQSRVPKGVKSGVAMQILSEQDATQLLPITIGIEQQLGFFCERVLDIIEAKYSENRLLTITGKEMEAEVRTFKGSDLKGNKRIKISIGSALPMSKSARQNFILMLAEKGYIGKEKALELLEFSDIEGIYRSVDESNAKSENQEMAKGEVVVPMDIDNHTTHLRVHTEYMKRPSFKEIKEKVETVFRDHIKVHQEFVQREMQAAQQMGGK